MTLPITLNFDCDMYLCVRLLDTSEGAEKLLVYDFKNVSNLRSPNYVRIYEFLDNMKNKLSESAFINEVKKLRHCEKKLRIKN
jgi:hypothetical protein